MKPLAIVCPSRGRAASCIRMAESSCATSGADVLLYVDSDDPEIWDYRGGVGNMNTESRAIRGRTILHVGPPIGRGHAVNRLCEQFRDYRMYLIVSDDITFDRLHWDLEVVEAMENFGDDIGCVHLASENGERYVNWACISRKWIDTLGWFNYPGCNHFTQDTIIQVLAEALGRITFIEPKVLTHHVIDHPDIEPRLNADCRAFLWYMAKQFGSDLAKLKAVMS